MLKLLILFVVLPLIELTLLLLLAEATRWWVSVVVVLLTGFIGIGLVRRQGWRTMSQIRQQLAQGEIPTDALLDGVLILIAGALMVTPGLLTDVFGISLLTPACRTLYKVRLNRWLKQRFQFSSFSSGSRIIDSYVVEKEANQPSVQPKKENPRN